ncbi:hypothetical protein MMC22_003356 [Lobaria immixta]|nr:hypothetical protein [Lobaria immixta]
MAITYFTETAIPGRLRKGRSLRTTKTFPAPPESIQFDPQYRNKRRKLDAKAHTAFLVSYESTNIYRVWIPHKKVISVRDVIFDEDECWVGKSIQFSINEIKELDVAIEIVEVPQSEEMEDLQRGEARRRPRGGIDDNTPSQP